MRVGDVMTQEILAIAPEAALKEAAEVMLREHVSGLPVISGRKLVGIVTEGDLLRRVETETERSRPRWLEFLTGAGTLAQEYVRSHARKVADVMTTEVVTATEDTELEAAVELMERRRVKRLPVLRGTQVVGIVSRANLLHALVASPPGGAKAQDKAIRDQLWAEIHNQRWKAQGTNIVVSNGVVDLWGYITDERHRNAIRVAAENIQGVKEIRDHLVWMAPYSGLILDAPVTPPPAVH